MSAFWSTLIIIGAVANLLACVWLIRWTARARPGDAAVGEATDHSWDGGDLRELNNPMPRWWLWMFYISIVFAFVYLALFPGFGSFQGWLGWSQEGRYQAEIDAAEQRYAPLFAAYAEQDAETLIADASAMQTGQRLFSNYCSQCHGSHAKGALGFPNLTDDDWLYGGSPDEIKTTLLHGRSGVMPALGAALGDDLDSVVSYLISLNVSVNSPDYAAGQAKFKQMCAACHGVDAKGNTALGAPNLNDEIWLYGGSRAAIRKTLLHGRNGQMPAFKDFLGEDKIHLLSAYVYSLSVPQAGK